MARMEWQKAPDIEKKIRELVFSRQLEYINPDRLIAFRSFGSTSRALARIWSLPRIWQQALKIVPHYCLEVIAERFDRYPASQQEKILLHELGHIPKNFSGALLSHAQLKRIR